MGTYMLAYFLDLHSLKYCLGYCALSCQFYQLASAEYCTLLERCLSHDKCFHAFQPTHGSLAPWSEVYSSHSVVYSPHNPTLDPPTWYFSLFFSVLCSEVLSSSWPFSKLISGHYLVICYRLSIEECHVCCPLSLPFRSFSLTSPLLRWRASRPSTPSLSLTFPKVLMDRKM